ncbi:PIG-L deacetylase family protein [Anatilimnocola floriformis]|uniref:PIG-L deacetylase family protein n=1 Tax=Anatilimnocola floriformis TaxID=2948575 RepID=UPI0020C438A9|nr:PIG-L family deacetylase [Anatilimnocola floriformis]
MPTALAIAAHPDDIEFLMAGTLLRLRAAGYEIHYWNLANGCCGTTQYDVQTIAKMRRQEGMNAAAAMGATFHESICDDLGIFYDRPTLAKVAAVIREVAPTIVLTHSPSDYMEDHTNACRLATTAAFTRGMPNFSTDPPRPHVANKVTVYHAQPYSHRDPLGNLIEPKLMVDVTSLQAQKRELLALHVSQKHWLDESQGLDSYLDTMSALDAELGRMSCVFDYAEGWRRHLHMGFCDPADDPLRAALGSHVLVAGSPSPQSPAAEV